MQESVEKSGFLGVSGGSSFVTAHAMTVKLSLAGGESANKNEMKSIMLQLF